jgi:hypothetical protein
MFQTESRFAVGESVVWDQESIDTAGGLSSQRTLGNGPFRILATHPSRLPVWGFWEQLELWDYHWTVTIKHPTKKFPYNLVFSDQYFKEVAAPS